MKLLEEMGDESEAAAAADEVPVLPISELPLPAENHAFKVVH